MIDLGDRINDSTISFCWPTNAKDGSKINRSVNGTIIIYRNNSTAEIVAGITDLGGSGGGFDGKTGLNNCTIDLSADVNYAIGNDYSVVLDDATIDGEAVVTTIACFSIQNRYHASEQMQAACEAAVTGNATIIAIAAKTGNLPATPAGRGDQMNLQNAAITQQKYDESTAHPLRLADDGATKIARRGTSDITITDVQNGTQAAKLASDGLDSISTAEPDVYATLNFRERMLAVFRWLFGKTWHHKTAPGQGEMKVYKENAVDVLTTQITSDDGTDAERGEAS